MIGQAFPAERIYKVLTRRELEQAKEAGVFTGSAVDHADGFIHFSTAAQLRETLRRHFAGQTDLMVLAVPTARLGSALRWEASRGGELFPHLYASLDLGLVMDEAPVSVGTDGGCDLPDMVH